MFKRIKPLSWQEWLICSLGIFFIGLGMGYVDVGVMDYGIIFLILGLILEIPAFYLIYKHR
jgi:hypothetical protein